VGIDNLMEDVATAEIARSQIWQWVRHGVSTADGIPITADLVRSMLTEELAGVTAETAEQAAGVFEEVALSADFVEFLTLPAYELID
jgi:malate synthase